MEHDFEIAALSFVRSMKETETYKNYAYQLAKLRERPEKLQQVNEFRRKNFEIKKKNQVDELFDKMNAFETEYEKFREDPLVDDFLRAELAFCRMMQEVDIYIVQELDFE